MASREVNRGLLVKVVLEYVVCGGLRGELFVELMGMMGLTGYRDEEEEEEEEEVEVSVVAKEETRGVGGLGCTLM